MWLVNVDVQANDFDPIAPPDSLVGMLRRIRCGQLTRNHLLHKLCRCVALSFRWCFIPILLIPSVVSATDLHCYFSGFDFNNIFVICIPSHLTYSVKVHSASFIYLPCIRFAGIHCQFITGYSKGSAYRPGMPMKNNHLFYCAWLAVHVADGWRFVNVDCAVPTQAERGYYYSG